ncbi:hypothetical protein [uncultured Desulfosarcina sp.]|uniref:hypothetical protein n=1 Tax=uncultured Desulfosarcina sp. TaxID=218289 RepID=UPI0029C64C62|nr:hypothetical protein [uncultured Desulfosarcina sp.]
MDLKFTPVLSRKDKLIFPYIQHFFINGVRSPPTKAMLQELNAPPCIYSDSGGYQIYLAKDRLMKGKKTNPVVVAPGEGNRQSKGLQIIDPIALCTMYGQLNVVCGFTLDFPIVDGSIEEYTANLSKSYKCAEIMFGCRSRLCPDTDLLIPLQFSTKEQLYNYYTEMSVLCPDGYSFPVRERTNWKYLLRVAFTLMFLHHKGVQIVHMLGSSKPEIIIIGAVAASLNMFHRVTFDSSTWDTARMVPPKYISPDDLTQKDIRRLGSFQAELPKGLVDELGTGKKELPRQDFYKLIPLSNIMTINRYTNKMLELSKDLEELKLFVRKHPHFRRTNEMLIDALNVLQLGLVNGYPFVEKHFEWIWYS